MQSVGLPPAHILQIICMTLPSPESPMDVSKTLKRLSRFNLDQIEHLIDMLRMTIATQPQNGNGSIPELAAVMVPAVTTPPPRPSKPTQSDPAISKTLESASLAKIKSREQPSQLSLSTECVNKDVSAHSSQEHLVYVNAIPALVGEKENGRSDKGERE